MQDTNKVKITIGIPVYNGEKFLSEKISSILNQNYSSFELIISDNGSTDMTQEICKKYANMDKRIRFFHHEKNLGPTWNFDFILKQANGEYFMWTAADDKVLPGYFEKNIIVLENNSKIVCSASQVKSYGKKTEYLKSNNTQNFFEKVRKKVITHFSTLKNYSTSGTFENKIRMYLKLRGHHQIFFGVYRTNQIKKFFVSDFATGFDFATMLNALKYGDYFVLDEVLNYRYDGGSSSSGFYNYVKSCKLTFFESMFLLYPLINWCWKNLGYKIFFKNLDCIIKLHIEMIFYCVIDTARKIGLTKVINPKYI